MMPRPPARALRSRSLIVALAAAGGGLFALVALSQFGVLSLGLFAAMAAGLVLINRPGVLFAIVLALSVVCQYNAEGLLGPTGAFFQARGLSPQEALVFMLLAAVIFDGTRRRDLRMPDPFTVPLLLVGVAVIAGAVVGYAAGAGPADILANLRNVVLLMVFPFIVVNVVRGERELRRLLVGLAGLTLFLSVVGLAAAAVGQGQGEFESAQSTYYLPTPVWLMLGYVLMVLAASLMRVKLPRWVTWSTPIVFLALALSYQRAFWLGTVIGVVVVIAVATATFGRRLAIPAVAVVIFALWGTLAGGLVTDLQGPLVDRVESLEPSKVLTNVQDRYRIGERQNVLADIEESPIAGLGAGMPWTARYGLSVEHVGARQYTHIVTLWWWLKMGILGLLAYLALAVTALVAAFRLRRRAADPLVRVFAAAMVGSFVGLAVIETTASYTGLDPSFNVALTTAWGILSVAWIERRSYLARRTPAKKNFPATLKRTEESAREAAPVAG